MTDYNAKAREIVDNLVVGDCLPHLEQWQYDVTVSTLESILQAARPATELRGKIQQLCEKAKEINGQIQAEGRHGHVVCGMSEMLNALAREVLAQLETP